VSIRFPLICAAAVAALGFAVAPAMAAQTSSSNCFLAENWDSWRSPSPKVIYVRVGVNEVYQLDLSSGSDQLQWPDMHLVSRIQGSDWICSPLDLQLEVADNDGGFREPLIVKAITRLTPDQVKAIPAKYRP
jgi:hypothetical protein